MYKDKFDTRSISLCLSAGRSRFGRGFSIARTTRSSCNTESVQALFRRSCRRAVRATAYNTRPAAGEKATRYVAESFAALALRPRSSESERKDTDMLCYAPLASSRSDTRGLFSRPPAARRTKHGTFVRAQVHTVHTHNDMHSPSRPAVIPAESFYIVSQQAND